MIDLGYLPHPSHCFCQIPYSELRRWVIKRYVEHHSTVELIQSTDDPREKEIICLVALFDVDDNTLLKMMANVDMPEKHIRQCRHVFKEIVENDALDG